MGVNYHRLTNKLIARTDAGSCGGGAKKAGLAPTTDFNRVPHNIFKSNTVSTCPPFQLCKCGTRAKVIKYHGGPQSYARIHLGTATN